MNYIYRVLDEDHFYLNDQLVDLNDVNDQYRQKCNGGYDT